MRLVPLCLAALLLALPAAAQTPAKVYFGAATTPADLPTHPHGSYARGCLAGGVQLPETGPGWQAMRLSRGRNWGHPEAIAYIERLSRAAQAIGLAGLFIGDISQPRGGPMRSGHRSHQIGLDIDIWLRLAGRLAYSRAERESLGSPRLVTADRLSVTAGWTPQHHALLKAAASDPAVARIFVNAAIKAAMCAAEPPGNRDWLGKIRPWYGHDAHFHVRLLCPPGAVFCENQDPPPPGDGCGDELAWWFSDEALNPTPGGGGGRRELTMDDLPAACASVVAQ